MLLINGFKMFDMQHRPIINLEEVDEAETDFVFYREDR